MTHGADNQQAAPISTVGARAWRLAAGAAAPGRWAEGLVARRPLAQGPILAAAAPGERFLRRALAATPASFPLLARLVAPESPWAGSTWTRSPEDVSARPADLTSGRAPAPGDATARRRSDAAPAQWSDAASNPAPLADRPASLAPARVPPADRATQPAPSSAPLIARLADPAPPRTPPADPASPWRPLYTPHADPAPHRVPLAERLADPAHVRTPEPGPHRVPLAERLADPAQVRTSEPRPHRVPLAGPASHRAPLGDRAADPTPALAPLVARLAERVLHPAPPVARLADATFARLPEPARARTPLDTRRADAASLSAPLPTGPGGSAPARAPLIARLAEPTVARLPATVASPATPHGYAHASAGHHYDPTMSYGSDQAPARMPLSNRSPEPVTTPAPRGARGAEQAPVSAPLVARVADPAPVRGSLANRSPEPATPAPLGAHPADPTLARLPDLASSRVLPARAPLAEPTAARAPLVTRLADSAQGRAPEAETPQGRGTASPGQRSAPTIARLPEPTQAGAPLLSRLLDPAWSPPALRPLQLARVRPAEPETDAYADNDLPATPFEAARPFAGQSAQPATPWSWDAPAPSVDPGAAVAQRSVSVSPGRPVPSGAANRAHLPLVARGGAPDPDGSSVFADRPASPPDPAEALHAQLVAEFRGRRATEPARGAAPVAQRAPALDLLRPLAAQALAPAGDALAEAAGPAQEQVAGLVGTLTGALTGEGEPSEQGGQGQGSPPVDIEALAQKVYEHLRRRLQIEHERLGRY